MDLVDKKCHPCDDKTPRLSPEQAKALLLQTPGWDLPAGAKEIARLFTFDSYEAGLAFANAVAGIAIRETHHPEITLLYKRVKVAYSTHSIGGLSENDFICAAKVSALKP